MRATKTKNGVKIDLRPRCARCQTMPRGKAQIAEFERYQPFCSYHCQCMAAIHGARRHLDSLKDSSNGNH